MELKDPINCLINNLDSEFVNPQWNWKTIVHEKIIEKIL